MATSVNIFLYFLFIIYLLIYLLFFADFIFQLIEFLFSKYMLKLQLHLNHDVSGSPEISEPGIDLVYIPMGKIPEKKHFISCTSDANQISLGYL